MADEESFVGFDTDEIEIEDEEETLMDSIAPKFNNELFQLHIDAIGRAEIGSEKDTYKFWVIKCLLTERYKYLAYDTDFGLEAEEIIRSNFDRDIAESELTRAITEALMVDERTLGVDDFTFEWNGNYTHITFLIESVYGEDEIDIALGGDDDVGEASFSSS